MRRVSEDITPDYPGLEKLVQDMFYTMDEADGVGLAAPQIGLNIRLFVVDSSAFADQDPTCRGFRKVFMNAHILERRGNEILRNEGCLSVPGKTGSVTRPNYVKAAAQDEELNEFEIEGEELLARALIHEVEHLDGHLFVEKVEGPLMDVEMVEEEE